MIFSVDIPVRSQNETYKCAQYINATLGLKVTRQQIIKCVVDCINQTPFQAYYRKQPHGEWVTNWQQRLEAYFWPNPQVGYNETKSWVDQLMVKMVPLVSARLDKQSWSNDQFQEAKAFTEEIFRWGGVSASIQNISDETVQSVIDSAIFGKKMNDAPMNSAWTKLAAFSSLCCPPEFHQAIWDSRVSHSLISRIDECFGRRDVAQLFNMQLGWVPGRGGNRKALPEYSVRWPRGYRSWASHFEAASILREITGILNLSPATYGRLDGDAWSVRDVEMVLFMDGY